LTARSRSENNLPASYLVESAAKTLDRYFGMVYGFLTNLKPIPAWWREYR
jgi:hypothetical protein